MKVIEILVSPQGQTQVQTRGYLGSDCLSASKFLEQALGIPLQEVKTAEFYQTQAAEQRLQH